MNNDLRQKIDRRLSELSALPKMKSDSSIAQLLKEKGFTRRDFMKWAGAMTAFMALPSCVLKSFDCLLMAFIALSKSLKSIPKVRVAFFAIRFAP